MHQVIKNVLDTRSLGLKWKPNGLKWEPNGSKSNAGKLYICNSDHDEDPVKRKNVSGFIL